MVKMNDKEAERVAQILKAVAHPIRLKIIEVLSKGECCVGDIMGAVGGKQSITSQQLCMMKDRGVLGCRKDGAKVYYHIENKNIIKLLNCICERDERK